MYSGFSFERALTFGFKAPHIKSFPWLVGLASGLGATLTTLLLFWATKAQTVNIANKLEAFLTSGIEPEQEEVIALLKQFAMGVWPIFGAAILAYWVISAIVTTATMRRYVRDASFSIGFGADEMRIMALQLMWTLMGLIVMAPFILILGGFFWSTFSDVAAGGPDPSEAAVLSAVFGSFGISIFLFPIYVFLATRLAPCFALTVKNRRIRFFDAWNVSRRRFWPILGAYVIIAIVGSIVVNIVNQIVQTGLLMSIPFDEMANMESFTGVVDVLFSPTVIIMVALMVFIQAATQAIYNHFAAAPAALAARFDPREELGQQQNIDVFS